MEVLFSLKRTIVTTKFSPYYSLPPQDRLLDLLLVNIDPDRSFSPKNPLKWDFYLSYTVLPELTYFTVT